MTGVPALVVCSLEEWDEVWRRNQFLADGLLRRDPRLRILFVEPPADPLHDLSVRRRPRALRVRRLRDDGRLWALRPLKPLPRRAGPLGDALLRGQVLLAARLLRLPSPLLWLNDVTYAPLIEATGWPAVYDVTDDWLRAPASRRELDRLRTLDELALATAQEVVVCSEDLARSRGARRKVSLVPNAVDAAHFQRPTTRPADLPEGPVAVYVGSLHDSRLDVELVVELARELPELSIALVGPDALSAEARSLLRSGARVTLLGPRPYHAVPAYLQHADVLVVPHRVTPFTESLDPIKAYECLAVPTPTVATPVAGFRELDGLVTLAGRDGFVAAVRTVLAGGGPSASRPTLPSWDDRATEFGAILERAARR
ncbi:MAG TPA: glycosyltransferase [Gaiellaceae bacterium]|nr:glycosyltransferase [Gaiellaceae bacterium]